MGLSVKWVHCKKVNTLQTFQKLQYKSNIYKYNTIQEIQEEEEEEEKEEEGEGEEEEGAFCNENKKILTTWWWCRGRQHKKKIKFGNVK